MSEAFTVTHHSLTDSPRGTSSVVNSIMVSVPNGCDIFVFYYPFSMFRYVYIHKYLPLCTVTCCTDL